MTAPVTPRAAPQARPQPHQIDPERAAFYAALWGDAEGYVQIAAGLPAADILARGWPLAEGERPSDPAELGDKVLMLLWTRETGDAFKAAGRPHEAKVFHWPSEARALDRYVVKLARDYGNVYARKYLAATPQGAKHGEAPAVAQVVQVEDAPAELPAWAPPFSFTLQTSDYSRQGFYRLPRPLPWSQVERLAAGLAERLGADNGGANAAQFTRIPTTRNTKARAGRYRVRFAPGAGPVDLGELARAALPGGLAELGRGAQASDKPPLSDRRDRAPGDLAGDAEREPWRSRSTRDALDAEAAIWRGLVRTGRGGLLADSGAPRAFKKAYPLDLWGGPGTGDGSVDVYRVYRSLIYHGYSDGQALALAEHFAHTYRPDYVRRRGAAGAWVDLVRVHFKVCAELGDKRRVREAQPPAGVAPVPGPEAPRARRGRPKGLRAAQVERLGELLAARVGERVTRPQLAQLLGVGPRAVGCYLGRLRASDAWAVELRSLGRGGLLVVRCARNEDHKSAGEMVIAGPEMRIAPEATPQQDAANERAEALLGDHTPPDPTPCPAPAAAPATGEAEAPALDLAALEGAEVRILEAVATIHAERVDRLDRATGEVVARPLPATRRRVAELLPDMPPPLFDAAWKRYRDPWGRERRRLWRLDPAGLAAAAHTATRKHAQAVTRGSPRAPYLAALAALALEVCARRGVDPTAPTKRRARKGKAEARERARAQIAAVPGMLRLLEAERPESVSQVPDLWAALDADRFRRGEIGGLTLKGAPPLAPQAAAPVTGKRQAPGGAEPPPAAAGRAAPVTAPVTPMAGAADPWAALMGDTERMARAGRSLAERAARGESLTLPGKVAACAD